MALVWGVRAFVSDDRRNGTSVEEMVTIAQEVVAQAKVGSSGNSIVIAAGVPFGVAGSTNLLRVAKIP